MLECAGRRSPRLATELPFRGLPTGLSSELFASTLDVYLTLGDIPPDPKDLSTPDGRPATRAAARDRLARMVGADRDGFTAEDTQAFAQAADEALLARLKRAADRVCVRRSAGLVWPWSLSEGEFLARRLAERILEPGQPHPQFESGLGPRRLNGRLRLRVAGPR